MKGCQRYMAHALSYGAYYLPYAVVTCNVQNVLLSVSGYSEELPNTIFISGEIRIVEEGQPLASSSASQKVDLPLMLDLLSKSTSSLIVVLPSSH